MQFDWNHLFPPGEPVIALPNWQHPRLLLSARRYDQRWRDSGFYLAFRIRAKLYKQLLRLRAATKTTAVRYAQGDTWVLGEFLDGVVDSPHPPTVWIGTNGASQKWTVRVRGGDGEPVAFVKWGFTESACRRIVAEHGILCALPRGLGPHPLRVGPLAGGTALAMSSINGPLLGRFTRGICARLADFLEILAVQTPLPIDEHPGFAALASDAPTPISAWIEQLADESWPVVIHHGDFAPWNVIDVSKDTIDWGGCLAAIDWESAAMNGVPFLDAAHYHLQIAGLLMKLGPASATSLAVERLMRRPWPALSQVHAAAFTALSAYAAWRRSLDEGGNADEPQQRWHRTIWDRSPLAGRTTLTNMGILPRFPALVSVGVDPTIEPRA
jgi:hypothetical protein